mgnify:CR=1 FL=1
MKKLKKFAALLLVGVMALALLTACGGGGDGMVTNKDEENKVISRISQDHGNIAVTNDEGLRAIAEGHLNMDREKLDGRFKLYGYTGALQFHKNDVGDDLVITITARYDYKDTLLSYVLDKISHHVDTDHNASVEQDGNWSNIGVVVKSNNEQSYIGISIRIKGKK